MKSLRAIGVVAVLAIAAVIGYRVFAPHAPRASHSVAVYYVKGDGSTLTHWNVSLGPARDPASVAFYAATQAVAGPPPEIEAVRFPSGTFVRSVHVESGTASVDLGGTVSGKQDGSLAEDGEFKALVYTMTALPGVKAVRVRIDGARVATLPGGHLELDEPLTPRSW